MSHLITPYGGRLANPMLSEEESRKLQGELQDDASWDLTPRQICDLELLLVGGFSPLDRFMGRKDYEGVCKDMRLADGTLWPMPITLNIAEETAEELSNGDRLVLRDPEGVPLAAVVVDEIWQPDLEAEAEQVFGTLDRKHPGVAHLLEKTPKYAVSGELIGLQLPYHYDFAALRKSPADVREDFTRSGWRKVVAFQTRNPMHRAHFELTLRACKTRGTNLLIHPVVGMTKPGDLDHYTRVRCYRALREHYPPQLADLALLPLAMRMGGPREALWHAIIRRNYGCTHFIVGRDHAGPGVDSNGEPFYGPYDAQELLKQHADEIGVEMVPFRMMVYLEDEARYVPEHEVPEGKTTKSISGTELRSRLAQGLELPEWFTFPEVTAELRKSHPARGQQGFTVFFTGLSGSGKSTVAKALMVRLLELGDRPVTLLDGDLVRKNLSSELGFSREHRDLNVTRIGYVASEITKNRGVALCAPIAPYDATRREVRETIESQGGFILVHVATPLEVCEQRDRKGLYAKARAGIIKEFTGISDPYEEPEDANIVLDTSQLTPEESVQKVLLHLETEGYLASR